MWDHHHDHDLKHYNDSLLSHMYKERWECGLLPQFLRIDRRCIRVGARRLLRDHDNNDHDDNDDVVLSLLQRERWKCNVLP